MDGVEPSTDYACELQSNISQQLYLNEEFADFHFVFQSADGQNERVPVHKAVLATGSEIFKIMFNDSWNKVNEVPIVDARCASFKEFLQCFYLSKVKLTAENIEQVINLGKQYIVPQCLEVCLEYFKTNLTYENVCSTYGIAIFYEQDDLKRLCETMIAVNTKAFLESTAFLKCEQELLKYILQIDALSCTEVELFEGVMNWIRTSNQQEVLTREMVETELGDLFYQIRFGSMTPGNFSKLIGKYGSLFTAEESQEIFQICSLNEYQPKMFTDARRKAYGFNSDTDASLECSRLMSEFGSNVPYFLKSTERAIFSSNQPLVLKSIYCAKISFHANENFYESTDTASIKSKMSIIEKKDQRNDDGAKTLDIMEAVFYTKNTTCIDMPKPIIVRPGYFYEIRMEQTVPPNSCSAVLLKSEVTIGSNTVIKFYEDRNIPSDNVSKRGLVSGLLFNPICG